MELGRSVYVAESSQNGFIGKLYIRFNCNKNTNKTQNCTNCKNIYITRFLLEIQDPLNNAVKISELNIMLFWPSAHFVHTLARILDILLLDFV